MNPDPVRCRQTRRSGSPPEIEEHKYQPMPTPNRQLRTRRKRAPLTQTELAEQVGVAVTSVRRWEAGWQPQPEHIRRLCAVLDASPAELGFVSGDIPALMEPGPDDQHHAMRARDGLAGLLTGWLVPASAGPEQRITISGSRAEGTDDRLIDDTVRSLGQLLVRHRCRVVHGPVGVGIEVMTHIADHYRPPGLGAVTGVFGRPNVVRDADFVLIVGGGEGTQAEFDLAASMGERVIPMPATRGTAARAYMAMQRHPELRTWISDEDFTALGAAASADDYVRIVGRLLTADAQAGDQG